MDELTEARRTLLDSIADEFLHNSPRGRRLLAVESETAERAARFADELAGVLDAKGQHVTRVSLGDIDEAALRRDTVEPFRAGTLAGASDPDAALVVDGRRLLNLAVRGIWHFSVWVLAGDELPHGSVNVIVDDTDAGSPTRYYYDLCRLPPTVGDRSAVPAEAPAT